MIVHIKGVKDKDGNMNVSPEYIGFLENLKKVHRQLYLKKQAYEQSGREVPEYLSNIIKDINKLYEQHVGPLPQYWKGRPLN